MELAMVSCGRAMDTDAHCSEVEEARPGAGTSGRRLQWPRQEMMRAANQASAMASLGVAWGGPASWQTQQGFLALLDGGGRGLKEAGYL